jgi:hypothetical protein
MKICPFLPLALSIGLCCGGPPNKLIASQIWAWGGQGAITQVPADLTNAVALAAGLSHALALTSDGRVIAWGDDSYQQIDVPAQLSNVVAIAAGDYHSLALKADGTVTAWGANFYGSSTIPSGLANVIAVSAASYFSVALKADGTVVAWGGNHQVPMSTNATSNMKKVITISAEADGLVALSADRTLNSWGASLFSPPQIASNIVGIALGGCCFSGYLVQLLADGSVAVSTTDIRCNLYPSNLTNVIQVVAGMASWMALKADGTVAVWGCGMQPPAGLSGATSVCLSPDGLNALYLAVADVAQPKVSISFVAPLNQTVVVGSQVQFSVSASGTPPLSYQWYFGTNALAGATNRWLSLSNVQFSQAGRYFVAVSNLESFATSQPVTLNVEPPQPPSSPVGPQSQTVFVGDPVVMSVTASGTPPFQYAWRLNGNSLAGATTSALQLASAVASNSGSYTVTLTNPAGSITSAPAQLRVKSVEFYLGNQLLTNGTYQFSAPPSLTLRSAFANGASFYTLDGSPPAFASTRYSGPLLVSSSAAVRAIGYSADFTQSEEADTVSVVVLERHSLSVSTPGGGTVTVNPPGNSFLSTNIVTLTAAPMPGWSLLYWLGDASGTNSVVAVSMEKDKALQAVFGTSLGTTSVGGGQVQIDPPGGIYAYGSVVRLTAIPQSGEYFGAWGNAGTGNLNPLYFTVTNASPTVSSIFGPIPVGQSTLTVLINGRGRVTVNPTGNAYATGQMLTLTPLPDPGQSFLSWSGALNGSQNPLSLSLSQSLTITGNFTSHAFLRTDRRGLEGLTPDGFRFTLVSDAPSVWQILGSTNLSFWESLGAITNSLGEVQFTDPGSAGRAERLYRGVQQP